MECCCMCCKRCTCKQGRQESYKAGSTCKGSDDDIKNAYPSQVQLNFDSNHGNRDAVTSQVIKSYHGLRGQRGPLGLKTQDSIELSGMGFMRQSSRYEYGFTKDYLSGSIKFVGSGDAHLKHTRSKYIAIQPDEDPDVVVKALAHKWNLHFPKLLISILGGDEEVTKANQAMKRAFCKGLVEAVLSTDVWLFTGGLNCGMMKSVGQALTNYAIGRAMVKHRNVVAVGVAPLAFLSQKDKLLGSERRPVMYVMDGDKGTSDGDGDDEDGDDERDDDAPCYHLEPNHTHFILVGKEDSVAGEEVRMRNELVYKIADCKIEGSNATVPVLHLLFGGDDAAIQTVYDAVTKHRIPVLVIPDSGGAASVLKIAINRRAQVEKTGEDNIAFDTQITQEIHMRLGVESKCYVKIKDQIKEIVKRRHLINIYNPEMRIEEAILSTLMNANRGCKGQDDLNLAVIWNRIDLAKKELLRHPKWKTTELRDSFYYALVSNQPKFVKLFIKESSIDLKEFLTAEMLVDLYNQVSESSVLYSLLNNEREKRHSGGARFSLQDVGNVLKILIFDTYEPIYNKDNFYDGNACFREPLQELFLWAILLHQFKMAKMFWKQGKPSIGGALLGSKILKALSELHTLPVHVEPQESAEMHEHAKEFQMMAIDFLNLCYTDDRHHTSLLLVRNLPDWGNSTCLDLAAAARNKQFIGHPAVQNLLQELWMGRLSLQTGLFKIWFCICCPFAALFLLTFMSKEDPSVPVERKKKYHFSEEGTEQGRSHEDVSSRPKNQNQSNKDDYQMTGCDETDDCFSVKTYMTHDSEQQESGVGLSCWYKLKLFHEAPVISFRLNMIAHFVFLGLFSYILLANFTETVSTYEIVLMVWVFTLFTEEVRQLLQEEYHTLSHRFYAWLWGYWNCCDLISLVMFAIGVGLRYHPTTLDAARIVLALDLIVFYLRILHIFSANKLLGPKLIMIMRMMVELVTFMAILMVFLVAYGVACQAILFPNSKDVSSIMKGVFYQSYFQLYGELFLDEIDDSECTAVHTAEASDSIQPCPQHSWFGTVVLALYLFISNILLLNLLIAMLNYTFQAIQENTDTFWKFQRYQLVKEYYQRPSVVPPLIIVVHVYQMVRWVWDKCSPRYKMYRSANLMKKSLRPEKQFEISTWEEVKGEDYLAEKKRQSYQESYKKMKQTDEKLEALSSKMSLDAMRLNKVLEGRFSKLEAQIDTLEQLIKVCKGMENVQDSVDGQLRLHGGHPQHNQEPYSFKKKAATLK